MPGAAARARTNGGVDWAAVERELAGVQAEFKDPKFYSLKYVVDVLTSPRPQALVAQVRPPQLLGSVY